MYAMGKLPPLSPHFINGTKIRTRIQLALYPHFFNTTVFTLFKSKTLIFILKGPPWKQSYVNAFLVSSQSQK